MKVKLWAAAGVALIGAAIYYFRNRAAQHSLPDKKSERHHLTNVFSKAKKIAVGN
jgi:hypothetical protein